MRVPGGTIADKLGGERVVLIAMIIILIAAMILSVSQSAVVGILAAVLLALGMGMGNAAVFKLVPLYVPEAVGGAAWVLSEVFSYRWSWGLLQVFMAFQVTPKDLSFLLFWR
mgnify:CR=1 FL=1